MITRGLRSSVNFTSLLAAVLLAVGLPIEAGACDTPVYRYAMYRWQPAPYEIYYFYDETSGPIDNPVHQIVNKYVDDEQQPANLVSLPVDLSKDKELKSVPPDVKQAWLKREDRALPAHMVVTPMGVELFTGTLDEAAVKSLVESPARQQLAQQLESGCAGVLLLLTCDDETANQAAEKEVRDLIKAVADGKVNLFQPPPSAFGEPAPQPNEDKQVKPEVGFVKVSRTDAKEAWFVRSLLTVESDLKDFNDPMVFAMYGRGRALPPYIGKGITSDNLGDCIQFLSGACSCTVKEQNPGADMLVRYDWELASEKLAAKFGTEEGNEGKFGADSFFPELLIPSSAPESEKPPVPATSDTEVASTEPTVVDTPATPPPPVQETPIVDQPKNSSAPVKQAAPASGNAQEKKVAAASNAARNASESVQREYGTVTIGVGVVAALVVLFVLTLLVLRPR